MIAHKGLFIVRGKKACTGLSIRQSRTHSLLTKLVVDFDSLGTWLDLVSDSVPPHS